MSDRHKGFLANFRSNKEELNDFLVSDALEYQRLHLGITYLLFSVENKLISYMTLAMGALKIPDEDFELRGKKLKE